MKTGNCWSETRYAHLNHKGKIICYRCRGHGVLALNIEFEGFTSQHVRLWSSQKDKVYLLQRKKRNKVCRQILSDKRNLKRVTVRIFRTKRKNIALGGIRL